MVKITTELSNQIRGLMKTFGRLVPAGKGSHFESNVRGPIVDQKELSPISLPMLEAWRSMRLCAAVLGRQLIADARQTISAKCVVHIEGSPAKLQHAAADAGREDNPAPGKHLSQIARALTAHQRLDNPISFQAIVQFPEVARAGQGEHC